MIGQILLNGGAHDAILRRRWRCRHLRDEMWVIGITGLCERHLMADQWTSRLLL